MDLEETEARIVEQLERILDAEERIVEWDTWIERMKHCAPRTDGYYKLATAIRISDEYRVVSNDLTWIHSQMAYERLEINEACKTIKQLIPAKVRNMDIGFDVRNQRFHITRTFDDRLEIRHREIVE